MHTIWGEANEETKLITATCNLENVPYHIMFLFQGEHMTHLSQVIGTSSSVLISKVLMS